MPAFAETIIIPFMPSWEPPLPDELQAMLPQYEITDILGRGGMGAVYKGRQAKLNRTVAIKVLPETLTAEGDEMNYAKRFEQEAQAMAQLDHPAIISVHDFGETSAGQLYFVMEFIDGMDIRQYLQQQGGRLSQNDSIAIIAHVLDALAYAHSHGIVHRDIKPANILLNRDGRVKIADFGLAKRFDGTDESARGLTMTNMVLGTPDFLAPEALETDRVVDHRADLYAVGVMLYQLLTGKLPRGAFDLPSEMFPDLDPRLDDIFVKAFSPDPDLRYPDASAVRADLDEVLSQPRSRLEMEAAAAQASTPPPSRVKPQPAPVKSKGPLYAGIGVAAALAVSAVVYFANRPAGPEGESGTGILPVASAEKTDDKEPTPVAEKPADPPAESVAKTPMPPERTDDKGQTPVAETPADPPAESIVKTSTPPEKPTPAVAVAAPPPEPAPAPEPSGGTPPPPSAPSPPPLQPDLAKRLDAYLAARRGQLDTLAGQYLRGLETRLDQAANARNLPLATAFRDERARVEALRTAMAAAPGDLAAEVARFPALPDLAEDAPKELVELRSVWKAQREKIRTDLDGKLTQSLQSLEGDLTQARRFDEAQAVLAYREGSVGTPARNESGVAATPPDPGPEADKSVRAPSGLPPASKERPFENSLKMKFVPVPGTDVLFCIHEVRYRDYAEYAKNAKGAVDGSWKDQTNDGFEIKRGGEDHPVAWVNWDDAWKFCEWLSEKEGRTYRLPTDREWSLAVGIGDQEEWKGDTTPATVFQPQDAFPWGGEWPPPAGAGNYSDQSRKEKVSRNAVGYVEGSYDDGFPTSAPVMSFAPNALGLHDLGGNVWEWVEDLHSDGQSFRVLRGGSWNNDERGTLLSSHRNRHAPESRRNLLGFRLVLAASEPAPPAQASKPTPPPAPVSPPTQSTAPALATKERPFENSLKMKFVPISITGGRTDGRTLLFSVWETRVADFVAYARGGRVRDDSWRGVSREGVTQTDDHPVVNVPWEEAERFCKWLSKKEGHRYRLPSDHEWSCAAGIGDKEDASATPVSKANVEPRVYPWGTGESPPDFANFQGIQTDAFPFTAPVGSFAPTAEGIHDLWGNVAEWCDDWHDPASEGQRVIRGHSWANYSTYRTMAMRLTIPPNNSTMVGFRVVLEIP